MSTCIQIYFICMQPYNVHQMAQSNVGEIDTKQTTVIMSVEETSDSGGGQDQELFKVVTTLTDHLENTEHIKVKGIV